MQGWEPGLPQGDYPRDDGDTMTNLDYATLPSLWRQYETMPRQLAFRARRLEEWAPWRAALLSKLEQLLGGFPIERAPLDPILLERGETAGYTWEKVAFRSEPDVQVPCYVLIPRGVKPPYRPVIALHGHGTGGAAHLLGRVVADETRAAEEEHIRRHNYDYARQLAERGFLVVAPEQRGFGERMEVWPNMIEGEPMWRKSCRAVALNAFLVGKTAIGLRVWDVMRTVDYILTRPEPMTARLGCLGFSSGGMTALFASALEPRITVAVVSGYLNSFRASIMPINHCYCNYVPNILQYAEMSDIAGLIAPRPLLVESGTQDENLPIAAATAAFAELRRVYDLLGVPERTEHDVFEGGHRFSGRRAFDWLGRW